MPDPIYARRFQHGVVLGRDDAADDNQNFLGAQGLDPFGDHGFLAGVLAVHADDLGIRFHGRGLGPAPGAPP